MGIALSLFHQSAFTRHRLSKLCRIGSETLIDTLRKGEDFLARKGVPSPRLEAQLIFAHVLRLTRIELFTQPDRPLITDELAALREALVLKGQGTPTAHILGSRDFYGRPFRVNRDVLIPRPETEELVERLLARHKKLQHIVDLGAGSGCIGITLALEAAADYLTLVDVSAAALAIAAVNAADLLAETQTRYTLLEADFTKGDLPISEAVDLVVSNPPYVLPEEFTGLDIAVKEFEPRLALIADDFAGLHRALAATAYALLRPGGVFALETHPGMVDHVCDWLRGQGFVSVEVCNDLAARPHFIVAQR